MGLGDYYLRMIQWKQKLQDGGIPDHNFLGIAYSNGPEATADAANEEYVITLIKNDMNFADAYLVLADIALARDGVYTAACCYTRAADLGHTTAPSLDRIERIAVGLPWPESGTFLLQEKMFVEELATARKWLKDYQGLEAQRIAESKPVDFATMKPLAAELLQAPVIVKRTYTADAELSKGTRRFMGESFYPWNLLLLAISGYLVHRHVADFRRSRKTKKTTPDTAEQQDD